MNTLRHPLLCTRNDTVHNIRKLWLLPILFFFFAVTSGCNESGLTGTGSFPEIVSTTPATNAESVPVNTSISVTFNEVMDSTSINEDTFIVKIGTVNISGTYSYTDLTAVFIPSIPLGYESTYSVMISSAVKSLSGISLADNHEWSFSTEEGANSNLPQVISTNPAHNADDVLPNSAIKVTFNRPMNPNSLNTSTFTVYQGSTPISGLVTSTSNTATFSPVSVLNYGSTYHAVISSDVEDTLGNKLENNFEWSFKTTEQEDAPPQVQSVSPSDDERDVPVDVVISASFSKALDNASVNSSTFLITQNGNSVSGSIGLSDSGTTISFTPNNDLPYEAEVIAVITTGVKDEAGNSLSTDYEWSFVTIDEPDTTPPQVQSVSPPDDERDVPVDVVISASFSKALDNASVNSSTFLITQNGNSVSGSIDLSDSGTTVSFTPNDDLPYEAEVTAVITTGIKDVAGNSLPADHEWSFVIMDEPDNISPKVISTSPEDNEKDVDLNSVITATFSEAINESTINNSTIIVKRDGDTVSGSISYSDNTVTFTPNRDLRENKTYKVTITTGIEDLAGNVLESDVVWTFRTEKDDDDDDDDDD